LCSAIWLVIAELGGDGGVGGLDALEGVQDLVVLAAARGPHGDDVLDAGAPDVGDVGLHPAACGAGPCRASDALLEPHGGQPDR
jgi:hypothetical protein